MKPSLPRLTSNTVLDTVRDMGNTSNGRAQFLGAANLAMQGKQIYDGLQGLRTMPTAGSNASGAAGTGGPLTGGSAVPGLSYGVSVSLGHNNSQGTNATNSTQAVGSSVTGAHNVNIVATGGGADSNVLISGSAITAGNAVNLAADNAVTLQASKDSNFTTGRDSSSGASVGAGTQNGLSFQVGVTQGKGRNDQVQVQNNPSQVSAGNAVNVSTGGDLNLIGSTVQANRVNADVGGNLNITTLQDVRAGNTSQSSSGLDLSVCIPPICYGATVMPSVNIAGASANGLTVSPTTQAGIRAGDQGFNVNVRGNTVLTGAVIQSTQAAIDANRNRFQTGGALTMTDLHNTSSARGAAYAAGASIGIGSSGPATDKAPNGINWAGGSGKPSGSAGVGSYSGDEQNSTTTSGISGIAGNQGVRTGDTTSAGTLVANWNTQAILQDVQAQARITAQFGQQASTAWGKYANDKLEEAKKNEDAQAIACWEANGTCRAAGHAVIGGLTGGAAGATGAVLSTQVAPILDRIAGEMGLNEASRNLVVAGLTTVVGATAGGVGGAAGAFNEVNNNFLTGKQVAQKEKELADCKKNDNCVAVSDKWKRLDMEQQGALDKLHEAERAMMKSPSDANVKQLADVKREWADLYEKFRLDGDTGGMKFVKDVYFTANLNYQLACANTASGCALPGRSEIMTSLAMSIDIAMVTDGALAGIARSVVNRLQGPITSESNAGISSVSGLRNQLEGQNISNIAAQDARLSAVLQGSGSKNPNFSIGSATSQESNKLGQIWVGDGARPLSGVPGGWISADETRVYRPPTTKPNTPAQFNPTGIQANFIVRDPNTGANISNGHLIIK